MPDIYPLLLSDRARVLKYLTNYPPEISELTFTNLLAWRHSRPIYYVELKNALIFLIKANKGYRQYIMFGPPLGPLSIPEATDALGDTFAGALRIPGQLVPSLRESGFSAKKDRDNSDYVYRIVDLAELAGRRYAKKRNQIKHCLQNFVCEYVPITAENIPECLAMQNRWCTGRQCDHDPGLCSENIAIAETFARFEEFGLIGGAIRVDGRIEAYSIAEQLQPGTAVCHFEKATMGIAGLGQLINQWFAKYSLSAFDFINREQDLGVPGLRQAKESYYPHHLVEKYTVAFSTSFPPSPLTSKRCPRL